jgi:hypothetical protein
MLSRPLRQNLAAGLLLLGAYYTYICPCQKLIGCHKWQFILSVGGASALVAYDYL